MRSLVICTPEHDIAAAAELATHLKLNCPSVLVQDTTVIHDPAETVEAVESALGAERVVLIASPHSIPASWTRSEWEPLLKNAANNSLAVLLVEDCRLPQLLRRKSFFDGATDRLEAIRNVRRWILGREYVLELPALPASSESTAALDERLLDRPGTALCVDQCLAATFVRSRALCFESVHWQRCAGRSFAGVQGDFLASSIDPRMRSLVVFDGIEPNHIQRLQITEGMSVITTAPSNNAPPSSSFEVVKSSFLNRPEDRPLCRKLLRDAELYLRSAEHAADGHFAEAVFRFLSSEQRLEEADLVLDVLLQIAEQHADAAKLRSWELERSWIRQTKPGTVRGSQLSLEWPE